MTAPKEIIELVERFENNLEEYRSGRYNETELRRDFVDPFFKALGWDVGNKGGRSELYREVVHEDSVKVRGSTKAPDYGFYVGGARKFFVEAKKPSVNLENDVKAAFQLRSYAWSAGLSISLLTDFEEFSIYDCRIEPANSDSPKVALLRHFTYDKYIDHWDQIAALFSREAVLGGSLERFIESRKRKKGTITVDEAFLREIDHWREILAKNVHKNNLDLTVRELNSSVQNTIDRIVFLRICEDRGIERDERLKDLLKGERAIYTMLVEQFRQADEKYNSGLFHFKKDNSRHGEPDELALGLKIDDAVLSEIIENLYPPKSPYRFSVIPAEILGHVYEQFLGKVISLGDDGDVEVEYKPEVRKAGGVYYTPTYIVDYIVENTVGKLLAGATPTTASELRILDPACGSGSFLIGAYQKLLDWHLEWYADHLVPLLEAKKPETSKEVRALLPESYSAAANDGAGAGGAGNNRKRGRGRPRKSSSATNAATAGQFPVFQAGGGEWRLTTAERKRILLNNIHGVDIDLAAVEVTKLSLQLKVLEGENQETLSRQLTLLNERALPDLGENIKCGNSLIGPDFYDRQTSLFDEEEMYRVNAFDWEAEFPEIMGRGGFDAVIGNPPYIRIQNLREFQPEEVNYYEAFYESARGKYDLYILFLEKNVHLVKQNGIFGMIVPNKLLISDYGKNIRKILSELGSIDELVSFEQLQIFDQASIYTCLLFWVNDTRERYQYIEFSSLDKINDDLKQIKQLTNTNRFAKASLPVPVGQDEWNPTVNQAANIVLTLPSRWNNLQSIAQRIFQGIITGGDKLFLFEIRSIGTQRTTVYSREFKSEFEIESELLRPFLRGSNIKRYLLQDPEFYVLHLYKLVDKKTVYLSEDEIEHQYPLCWEYLKHAKSKMSSRGSARMKYPIWYGLWNPRDLRLLESPKLLVPTIANKPSFSFDTVGEYFFLGSGAGGPGCYGLILPEGPHSPYYVLGLLNSRVTDIFINATSSVFRGGYRAYSQQFLQGIPFRSIDFSDPADVARHDSMVALVENMLDLHRRLAEAKTGHENTLLSRQIDGIDRRIDALVYELYELTAEEIKIVKDL